MTSVAVTVAVVAGLFVSVPVTASASTPILTPPLPTYNAPSLINYNLLYPSGPNSDFVEGAVPTYYNGGVDGVNTPGVEDLEQQAIANTITDHGLPTETNEGGPESELVATWGRNDAEAELWALLVQAINTPAASRTTDQAEAVAWLTQAVTGYNTTLALQAAYQYAAWAGLGEGNLDELLSDTSWTQSSLETFLSQPPEAYGSGYSENSPEETWNEGYCVYDPPGSPSYTSNIYSGGTATISPLCYGQCPSISGCPVTPPSLQDFIDWGQVAEQDDGTPGISQTAGSVAVSSNVAEAIGFGATVAGTSAAGLALTPSLAAALATPELAAATAPFTFLSGEAALATGQLEIAAGAAGTAAFSIASAFAIVLTAVAAIVIDALQTFSESVPDQLASYIAGQETAPDLTSMLTSTSGYQELYTVFINATGPAPSLSSCDDTDLEVSTVYVLPTPCLNAPAIPAATASDPQFTITEEGATTSTTSPTISWEDAMTGTTNTARIADRDWWVQTQTSSSGTVTTAQTLEINYTDWQGNARVAWLQVDPSTGAYTFLTDTMSATSGVDTTCAASGACTDSSSIEYVGTDGNDYTASVPGTGQPIPPLPTLATYPVGIDLSVSPSVVVTGQPVTLTAELTSPDGLNGLPSGVGTVTSSGQVTFNYGTMTFTETVDGVTTTLCSDAPEDLTSSNPSVLSVVEATCPATFTSTDPATVTATYNPPGGNGAYQPATETLDLVPTDLVPTTTTVTANTTQAQVGLGSTYTAIVADQVSGPAPTGTVTFTGAGASCHSVPLLATSKGLAATCSAVPTTVGSQTVTATYSGDSNTAASSGTLTVVADQDLPLTIEGSQVYGSSSPTFYVKLTSLPADVTITGAPTCEFLSNFDLITKFLAPGNYTLLGSECTGVTLSNPYYFVAYNGGTFTVNPAPASITLSPGPTNPVVGGTYTVGGTASSGAPVSFTIDSKTANNCSLSGSTVTFEHAGPCLIDATAPATADYAAPNPVQEQITIGPAQQAVTITGPTSGPVDGSATLSATGGPSGNPVSFHLESSGYTCRLDGATVTFYAVGNCIVDAFEEGNDDYLSGSGSITIAVVQATSTTTLSTSPATPTAGSPFKVTATITPQGPPTTPTGKVTFSLDGTTVGSPVEVGGAGATSDPITVLTAGAYTVTADYSGDGNFTASTATLQVTVGALPQTIHFTAPASGTVGGSTVLSATGGASGQPVTFSVDSTGTSPADACTVSGDRVTYVHAGTCVIDANQAGTASYAPAAPVQGSVTVSPAVPTVTVAAAPASGATSAMPVTVSATVAGATGAVVPTGTVTFGATAATCGTVSLVSGVASCSLGDLAAGTYSFTASYGGDSDYVSQSGSLAGYQVTAASASPTWSPGPSGPGEAPPARSSPAMATSPSGVTLLFGGGGTGNSFLSDTWELTSTASTWQELTAAATTAPSGRTGASMVWDSALSEFVLYGGVNSTGLLSGTWAFDPGTGTWSELATTGSPGPLAYSGMAALSDGEVVLFGGLGNAGFLSGTWAFDPATLTWTEQSASGPSGRYAPAMAAGPSGTVLLYGGAGAGGYDGDLWSYDTTSNTWAEVSPTGSAPPPLAGAALGYDPSSGDFVLFGGEGASSFSAATYSYDPATTVWTALAPQVSPPSRAAAGISYDPAANVFVLFGGWDGSSFLDDTWELPG